MYKGICVFQAHVTLCACMCISVSGSTSLIRSRVCSVPWGPAAEAAGLLQNETNLFSPALLPLQNVQFFLSIKLNDIFLPAPS